MRTPGHTLKRVDALYLKQAMSLLSATHYLLLTDRLRRAQAALSTIFLVGGIIVLFGTSLAAITLSFANSSLGFQAGERALAVAQGGIKDAELQLLRNKDFADAGYCVPAHGTPCPAGSALVIVTQNSPITGKVLVIADATVNLRRRKLQAIYAVSPTSTLVTSLSLTTLSQ